MAPKAEVAPADRYEDPIAPNEPPPVDLPTPETLDKDSDFSAFLKDGVPEALRRRALRVLWRSDPVLANLDGLNDYDEDYRSIGTVVEAVRTAYAAGRGYLDREKPEQADAVASRASDQPLREVPETDDDAGQAREKVPPEADDSDGDPNAGVG